MTDYQPVDCAVYAKYELAILRRRPVMLGWRDDSGVTRLERVVPTDLETREGEEFLHFEDRARARGRVRLDRIVEWRASRGAAESPD